MDAVERENYRYANGARNSIAQDEFMMFSLLPQKNGKLLDVGCGTGAIGDELRKRGFEVTGLDFSEVAISKCRDKKMEARVCDVDKEGLPFPDESFDVVWGGDIIEHLFDPIFVLKEAFRVLKKDGALIISVPNNFPLNKRIKLCLSGKSPQSNIYRKAGQCKHHTFFSWELLSYMLSEASFKVEKLLSMFKIPRTKVYRQTNSKIVTQLFGRIFIVRAEKSDFRGES